jgi:hypothetical protein
MPGYFFDLRRARHHAACWVTCCALFGSIDAALASEPGWHTMKLSIVGCRDRPEFERIASIRMSGDKAAFEKAAVTAMAAGDCTILARGTEVYMQEIVMSDGLAKVRTRGNQTAYWIDYTYID